MSHRTTVILVQLACMSLALFGAHDPRVRTPVRVPDIPGYRTLKCDFHIHTVFSDGSVWPDIRPEEAWREGLDAIAITDHIEYQPHKDDLPTQHNRSFEIAKPHGDSLQIIVIRGSEVTRDMPPGHLNAIFLEDSAALDVENWRDALTEAVRQGGFIFWNHPGWEGQQPDGVARWYPEHTELLGKGMLHGIEVANSREYYPEAHRWCLEKNLAMLSNSDVHNPLNLDYAVSDGDHRPLTLVFAKEASAESIHEALRSRRTAVYTGNLLIGREEYVRPIFEASVKQNARSIRLEGRKRAYLQISNSSDLDFELDLREGIPDLICPKRLVLTGGKTVLLELRTQREDLSETREIALPYKVTNVKLTPEHGLPVLFLVRVEFQPKQP